MTINVAGTGLQESFANKVVFPNGLSYAGVPVKCAKVPC